jgi:hypothetical protein
MQPASKTAGHGQAGPYVVGIGASAGGLVGSPSTAIKSASNPDFTAPIWLSRCSTLAAHRRRRTQHLGRLHARFGHQLAGMARWAKTPASLPQAMMTPASSASLNLARFLPHAMKPIRTKARMRRRRGRNRSFAWLLATVAFLRMPKVRGWHPYHFPCGIGVRMPKVPPADRLSPGRFLTTRRGGHTRFFYVPILNYRANCRLTLPALGRQALCSRASREWQPGAWQDPYLVLTLYRTPAGGAFASALRLASSPMFGSQTARVHHTGLVALGAKKCAAGTARVLSALPGPPKAGSDGADVEAVEQFAKQWREEHKRKWAEVDRLGEFCLFYKREALQKISRFDDKAEPGVFKPTPSAGKSGKQAIDASAVATRSFATLAAGWRCGRSNPGLAPGGHLAPTPGWALSRLWASRARSPRRAGDCPAPTGGTHDSVRAQLPRGTRAGRRDNNHPIEQPAAPPSCVCSTGLPPTCAASIQLLPDRCYE